jgi:hypothetical protein
MSDNGIKHLSLTMKEAAQMALDVQDACNLSGVVHGFSRVMTFLSDEANRTGKGTEWKNHHPIAALFSSKIASLTLSESMRLFNIPYGVVEKLAKGE